MYKLLFAFIFLTCGFYLNGQNIYDNCYFGTAGLNFHNDNRTVLTDSQMEAVESAVSISNSNGDLLFYSNVGNSPTFFSITGAVWNANHQIMENGI